MDIKQLFANKGRIGAGVSTSLDSLVVALESALNRNGASMVSASVASSALSLESIDGAAQAELTTEIEGLNTALESIYTQHAQQHGIEGQKFTASQIAAGVVAGIVSADPKKFIGTPVTRTVAQEANMSFLTPTGGDFLQARVPAMEAYDERENRNAVVYSVAYNMQAARQDEFGEAFFPTVVVTPDQVGITVSIRLVQVMNEIRRAISGDLNAFSRRNIIQAVIDPTILKNDQTKVVPVVRAESVAHFVATGDVAPYNVLVDDVSVSTAPLKFGSKLSLLGLGQTDALLETGLMDVTDALDTAVALNAVYLKVAGAGPTYETIKLNTARLPGATFNYAPQGNYREMQLNFTSDALHLEGAVKKVGGAASTLLASIGSGNYSVRLSATVFGKVNLETGDTVLNTGAVEVASVTDEDGNSLPLGSGAGATIAALFSGATLIGYDIDAQRTNTNRRQRGQLLDTTYYNQIYAVPLRSPITCPRPLTSGDQNDSSDLAALITATHVRTSNAAVDELFKTDAMLAEFVSSNDSLANAPAILGVSRFLVKPYYEKATLAVDDAVDSLTSSGRAADIQAVIVNKLRDMVYRMYTASGYKAAADALAGGQSATPTVIIGTDPTIARYLMVDGDFRTLGPDFQVKVVSTLNQTMKGKIFVSFGDFSSGKEGVVNPMHFGNMAWKPELTLVLPIHRNGGNSKELTVQPSFLHIANLPVLARIDVTGIENVIADKVTVNVSQ
jgi:hypothetical protein